MKKAFLVLLSLSFLALVSACGTIDKPFSKKPATLDAQLSLLTKQIVNSLSEKNKSKIAVIEFSNLDGSVSQLGRYISEELITRLYRTGEFEVVERQMLNKIMREHELSLSGFIDESSAREIGMLLGVDAIASGSVTELVSEVKINARLISAETGKIFSVASVKVDKTQDVIQLLGSSSPAPVSISQSGEPAQPPTKPNYSPQMDGNFKVVREGFLIELNQCVMTSTQLKMEFTVTNQTDSDKEFCVKYGRPSTEIFDDAGNQYPISVIKVANSEIDFKRAGRYHYRNITKKLIKNIPTKMEFVFRDVNTKANLVTLLQVNGCDYEFNFRDIPIKKQ